MSVPHRVSFALAVVAALALGPWISAPLLGDEPESHSPESAHAEHHPNLLAGFVGVALEDRRDNGLAVGIEYERRISERFGVGGLAEYTFGDFDVTVYAVPFAFHLGRWKLYGAPGIEDGQHGTEALLRIGAEYGFQVGSWEISPQVDLDFVDGDQIFVTGVTFGKGF
jgi:hypothetical protein